MIRQTQRFGLDKIFAFLHFCELLAPAQPANSYRPIGLGSIRL